MPRLLALIAPFTTASPDYLQRIQTAIVPVWQAQPDAATQPAPRSTLYEPLSARGWDVLQLVAEGLSNQQIAQHLVLSLYTAKLHVKHFLPNLNPTNPTHPAPRPPPLHILPH